MIPVFVPSYQRPNATFLKRSMLYSFPLYVFIRVEDKKRYLWLKDRPETHIILLRTVNNIGETRRAMVNYAISKKIDRIFMIDDDVRRLDISVWDPDKKLVRASGTIQGYPEDWKKVFNLWGNLWKEEALFGASYRPFVWSINKEDIEKIQRAQLQQAIGVNVKRLYDKGVTYRSSLVVGNEDLFLQLECYQNNLECVRTNMIQYDCPAMGIGKGGCNSSEPGEISDKQRKRVKLFLNSCSDPELVSVKTTHSGIQSIKFNWDKISVLMKGEL